MKKGKAILACVALAAALMLGLTVPAFAADAPVINKTLQHNDFYSQSQYHFDIEAIQLDTDVPGVTTSMDAPLPTIPTLTLETPGQPHSHTGSTTVQFDTWPHAGTYAWKVSEHNAGIIHSPGEPWRAHDIETQNDTQVYTLIADVKNGANPGEYDVNYIIIKGEATSTQGNDGKKVASMDFTNKVTAYISTLTIGKEVTGDGGDLTKQFEFTVTFTIPDETILPAGKTASDVLNEISYDTNNLFVAAFTAGGGTMTQDDQVAPGATTRTFKFTASHLQGIRFTNVLIGAKLSASETPVAGYTQTAKCVGDEGQHFYYDHITNVEVKSARTIGLITNTYNVTPPTALILNNLPFILMGLLAVAGLVVYGTVKKKLAR